MPYELDSGALMFENRAETRLRYFWLRANWLNDQAKAGGIDKLPDFLGGRRFRAVYAAKDKPKLKYHREDSDRNIYKPSKPTAVNYALDNHGKCNLHLYKLGDEEFARILRGGPYKGILVAAIKICVKFQNVMPWAKLASYFSGDLVSHAGAFYRAKADHSNKDFDAVADWTAIDPFAAGSTYNVGDTISHGGQLHEFTGAAANEWKTYPADLTNAQKVAQMEDLNNKFKSMFADAAAVGNFKLYGSGDFSPAADVAAQPFELCALAALNVQARVQGEPARLRRPVAPFPLALRRHRLQREHLLASPWPDCDPVGSMMP